MTLSKSKLESEFSKVIDENDPNFVGWPSTILAGINNFATAYENYAKDAVDYSEDALLTYNKAGFIGALTGLNINSTYVDAATAMENAFKAFWTKATFAVLKLIPPPLPPPAPPPECPNVGGLLLFSKENTSIIFATDVGNILYTTLLPELQKVEASDMTNKIARLADIWHTATTTTIICLISGLDTTAPSPLPITNLCHIH